ncbi:LuxR C-terminal-related transcriptional regulator [Thiomonas sp. FB-Cd]|uniref:LuxR C-terminal-related transcriptional regulator n=1 Tax=Thiomonas sp. FB-Cd TaxID=1158292 RepID=UPI00068BA3A2|nr:LuxR C-terminal-related transcriptional regulator [Thiomonas sp. FB-Cd]
MPHDPNRFDRPLLITTKFRAPSGACSLVTRERLLQRLHAQRQRRLTLIHGPAGFGKTTLSLQWRQRLQDAGVNVAWLSLSREDNPLDRFLTYLVEAVRVGDPTLDVDVAAQLEAHPEQAASIVVTELINAFEDAERDFYLILDDWHLIVERQVRDMMNSLLEHAPPGFHVVITSRERPSMPLARLRVSGELSEVDASDLRFTVSESQAFLCDLNELKLDAAAVHSLWSSTEGWVAALQLASLSLRNVADAPGSVERLSSDLHDGVATSFGGDHHALGEYLVENVLDLLPADVLDFLLATSILDRLCADLCAAVSGCNDSQRMLELLEKQDLFIQPLDEHRAWYRYHHLFAAHLQGRLERQSSERKAQLHRAASAWFGANAHTDEAVTHALAAGEAERAIELVQRDAMWLVQHSAMSTLRELVLRLPPNQLRDRPALQLAIAWAHCLTHRPVQARESLALAEAELTRRSLRNDVLDPDKETTEALAEVRVLEACVRIYQDEVDGVEELVRPCIAPDAPYRPWLVAVASNIFTYVLLHRHAYDDAITLQALTRPFHERTEGPFSGVYGRCFAGIASRELGRLDEAASTFRSAHALAVTGIGRHSHAARLAEALLGELLVEMNQLDEAARLLQDSRKLGVEGGVADFSIATYVGSSRLLAQYGDSAASNDALDEGEHAFRHLGFERLRAAVVGERVRHALLRRDLDTAQRLLMEAPIDAGVEEVQASRAAPSSQAIEWLALSHSRVFLASGRAAKAQTVLEPVLSAAIEGRRLLLEVRVRILMALALDGAGRLDLALDMAAMALRVGLAMGLRRSFLDEGSRFIEITQMVHERVLANQLPRAPWGSTLPALGDVELLGRSARAPDARPEAPAPEKRAAALGTAVGTLKRRETEILHLLARGQSNKEIARSLDIGVDTVKWYLKSIYGKLGVTTRATAVLAADRTVRFSEQGRKA